LHFHIHFANQIGAVSGRREFLLPETGTGKGVFLGTGEICQLRILKEQGFFSRDRHGKMV
jgi:hypothetical protein